jgi:pSer/pThr/pTyr-binding forkhead associated (FHA) protein
MTEILPLRALDMPALWASGRFALRAEGTRSGAAEFRRPYAVVGRSPDCDVVVDDPLVAPRHAYLHLDRRGLFAVDLASRSGSRIGPRHEPAGWLRPGDSFWVADRRITVTAVDVDDDGHARPGGDPLSDIAAGSLTQVTLYPDSSASPLILHSELVFVGRSGSCGVTVDDPAAAPVHCVLVRATEGAYVVDLIGRHVGLNGRPLRGWAALRDGDTLTIGAGRLECRLRPPADALALSACRPVPAPQPAVSAHLIGPDQQDQLVAWLVGMLQATQGELLRRQERFEHDVHQALRRIHSDQISGFREQLNRVEDLQRQVADLREDVRRCYTPAEPLRRPEPPRPPLPRPSGPTPGSPPPTLTPDDGTTAAWLSRRIQQVRDEARREGRGPRG